MSVRNSNGKALREKVQRHEDGSKEYWRDIVGYKGYYRVSTRGRVKSLSRIVPMSDGRIYRVTGRLLRPTQGTTYLQVALSKGTKERLLLLHRLVLEAFVGPCPEGMECRHFPDRNPKNCQLENLQWGTKKENGQDRVRHGTVRGQSPGEKHSLAKLTEKQAIKIKAGGRDKKSRDVLALKYGISEATVRDIQKGRSWTHLE